MNTVPRLPAPVRPVRNRRTVTDLSALREGDPVRLTVDGKTHDMTVLTELARADGGMFGHPDSSTVRVGFGWGRYCVMVSPASVRDGRHILERVTQVTLDNVP